MRTPISTSTRVEDVMTPRSVLVCTGEEELDRAEKVAHERDFDAVPIVKNGVIQQYWSRAEKRTLPITRRHRIPHDASVEEALPRLKDHLIQFVCYRAEIVGLLDLSDLNKPLARLTWLRPLLECEQAILMATLNSGFTEDEISRALGHAAESTRRRRRKALQKDLKLPLLCFAHFNDILNAGVKLGIVELSQEDVKKLSDLRNRSAHGARQLIENRSQGQELLWALAICRKIIRTANNTSLLGKRGQA